MILAKTEMEEIPVNCWNCDLIYSDSNGATRCCMTHESLYPVGVEKILDSCPLEEVEDGKV